MILDLDGFKAVNDQKGHLKGNEVLCGVARVIENALEVSCTCARLGGDEFAVILHNCEESQGLFVAENVRRRISEDASLSEDGVKASIGIAVFPKHGHTPVEILNAADTAMYRAKRAGGNRVEAASPPQ
jgi:diguanylate cyclase (GGDEF)-like protein